MTHRQMVGDQWVRYHYQSPTLHSCSALYSFSYIVASTKPTRWPAVYSWQLLDPAAATCLAGSTFTWGRGRDHHYVCIRRQPRVPSSFLFPWIKVADIFPAPHAFIRSQPCLQKRPSLSLPNCCQYLPAPFQKLPPTLFASSVCVGP